MDAKVAQDERDVCVRRSRVVPMPDWCPSLRGGAYRLTGRSHQSSRGGDGGNSVPLAEESTE